MTYYSALHYAAKAEKSATSAANSAQAAQTAAAQASQVSGKIIQLGFDGVMEDGKLVFKHAPGGVDVPYELLDDYEYEIDMAYAGLENLPASTQMVVENGEDIVTFVSALHRSSVVPATVGEMAPVARFDAVTGYRWLFKAAYKVTPAGTKVFLLYPVVTSYQQPIATISETSGTINLETTKIYQMEVTDTVGFVLPSVVGAYVFNQIKVMMKVTGTPTIDWGTANFFNKTTPEIEEGSYDVYFDYDNLLGAWVCGVMAKGAAE